MCTARPTHPILHVYGPVQPYHGGKDQGQKVTCISGHFALLPVREGVFVFQNLEAIESVRFGDGVLWAWLRELVNSHAASRDDRLFQLIPQEASHVVVQRHGERGVVVREMLPQLSHSATCRV